MTRDIPDVAVDFIAQHEGLRLTAYKDSVGVWTIGYGSTSGVEAGMTITKAEAKARLKVDLRQSATRIDQRIGAIVDELTENQYAALLSLVFNVGAGPGWTLWKRLKARQFDQIPGEIIKFCNAGGKKIQGLVNRRADEVKLWATDEPGSVGLSLPSSETRVMVTPPTPADPTPPAKSAQLISGGIAAATTTTVAVQQLSAQVLPFADRSERVGKIVQALAVVGAIAVVVGFVLAWLKKREARG